MFCFLAFYPGSADKLGANTHCDVCTEQPDLIVHGALLDTMIEQISSFLHISYSDDEDDFI